MATPDKIIVQVHFEIDAPSPDDKFAASYPYRSALTFTESEYKGLSNADISAAKSERHQAWRDELADGLVRAAKAQEPEALARTAATAKLLADRDLLAQGLAAQEALIAADQAEIVVAEPVEFILPPPAEIIDVAGG